LGGAYGGKIELPTAVAAATAVAATKLKRPVRLWMPLEHNMRMFGKRNPYLFDYKVRNPAQKTYKLVILKYY
jgi:xanthine dehydrogenase molybdopterin-binding subunit B